MAQSWEYDNKGNATRIFSSDGKDVRFVFDSSGNVIQSIKQGGTGTITTNFEYDLMNRLTKVTNPNGDITRYQYLPTGELSKIIAPNNKETVFEYNVLGKLTKKIETNGSSRLFSYDKNGNLIQETDPNGNIKILTYDQTDKLTQVQLPDDLISYEYNTRGEVTATENNISRLSMIRDSRKRVVLTRLEGKGSLADYPVVDLNYIYNENDQMTAMQSAVKNIGYGYDSANRLTSIATSSGDSYSFQYDNANRLTQINRPGSRSNFTYTASQMVDSIIHSSNGVTKSYWQYGYDDRNLPISKRGMAGQNDYSYDGNSQLTGATIPLSTAESFSYDSLGNRITDENGSYIYDQNQDLLTEDWQFTYGYDANGNMTMKSSKINGKPSYKFEYSSKNQLVKIQVLPDLLGSAVEKEIFYSYDVTGRRIEKKIADYTQNPASIKTRRDLYDGENIIAEYDGSNQLLATFTHSPLRADDVLGMNVTAAGVTAGVASVVGNVYYLKDMLGSITDIVDGAANVLQRYEYSSFGKILSIKNGSGIDVSLNPVIKQSFMFTGREWDEESGLYFYRARSYDASVGRFLQQDPDPGKLISPISINTKYSMTGNAPTLFNDPSGKSFLNDLAGYVFLLPSGIVNIVWGIATLDPARIVTGVAMLVEVYLSPINLIKNGRLPKYETYHGMQVVKNSLLAEWSGRPGFSLGAGSFVAYDGDATRLENTIKHEYGHYLQYSAWGGWTYISRAGQRIFSEGDSSDLETDADQRACKFFGPSNFIPNYGYHGGACGHTH